ncbi:DUF554 domain-containing protein [Fimbriimonas ginsengisoli]|uniref:DUF554 domain-containing protein n=1 Tax=Fimbriimonas ginsengisoli Gsoil 348 TaxID=661478 RepID=A0A068NSH5_FIMGI|nr:DUF554 domain-containing protein [Fimbriimonas ginsengisoli]AIE86307.1 hypothetical protein OP10G_2939 [Fimbriimonas ginsengisoli Gsoil 348]
MRGTLLNTTTVAVGASVGLLVGHSIPDSYKQVALHGLGLVTVGIGIGMFLRAKNPLISAIAIAFGGIIGLALGIHAGIEHLAEWLKAQLGAHGSSTFAEGLITTFVLFCVGPMTLLGCLQDALERKIDLLALKSTMDGIAAVFFAAALGPGVLVTAGLLLLFQGALTLMARPLRPLAEDPDALAELSGAGGAILLGTGIGLLGLADLHTANYLPAIFLAPLLVLIGRRIPKKAVAA